MARRIARRADAIKTSFNVEIIALTRSLAWSWRWPNTSLLGHRWDRSWISGLCELLLGRRRGGLVWLSKRWVFFMRRWRMCLLLVLILLLLLLLVLLLLMLLLLVLASATLQLLACKGLLSCHHSMFLLFLILRR